MKQLALTFTTSLLMLLSVSTLRGQETDASADAPRIFIAGDSTAAPGNGETQVGWGTPFADFFDPSAVEVRNKARGGRSSRTFITEGHWGRLLLEIDAGDLVLIQFGHNDGGAINREPPGSDRPLRARGTLPGLGNESEAIDNAVTGKHETVYTFGHYIQKMVADTRAKGAQPVLLSLTARNIWEDGRLERGSGDYGYWTYEIAKELEVPFIDLTGLVVERLEPLGPEAVAKLYPRDHTHTGPEGAKVHAEAVVAALKGLRPSPVEGWLSAVGEEVAKEDLTWLNLPFPAKKEVPNLILIGDSTVRNGRGDGSNGEWGWGDYLDAFFDESEINVVNRAVGGLSSRTFSTGPYWSKAKRMIKPGDFVMIQFGHNDAGALNDDRRARGTIRGVGEESEVIDNLLTGQRERVQSYGWYLRRYVEEARSLGATPIICSPVPRKKWKDDGTLARSEDSYPAWAEQVAKEEGVAFVDLHEIIADRYDELGAKKVDALFADAHTHTSLSGAELNAECVAEGLRRLERNPLREYMTLDAGFERPVRFVFGESAQDEAIAVEKGDIFNPERGYGYDLGTRPEGNNPWFFSVLAKDGNYRISIEFGDEEEASVNTVKAESRRLMVEKLATAKGKYATRNIIVNTRNEKLDPPERFAPGGAKVALNEREIGKLHWDDKLTLEFNGEAPRVRSVTIEAVTVPTVYLIGDSTVTDQPYEPAASWGQMLPRFFKPELAVANHAESGETMKSFISGLRLAKALQEMKAGDYLFIQFTHNDQKEQWPQTYVEAGSTYKAYLRVMIEEARLRGATPVLVTSMQRRRWNDRGEIVNTLGDYPKAMRELAKEQGVTLIDLEAMSVQFYESLGEDRAPLAFSNGGKDATHHNNYGAYELAKCVAQGIADSELPLAAFLVDGFEGYDPKRPDDPDSFELAESPFSSDLAPLGN